MLNKIVAVFVLIMVGRMIYAHLTGTEAPPPAGATDAYLFGRNIAKLVILGLGFFALRTLFSKSS